MEITWRVFAGRGRGRMGEKVQGIRSINGRHKIDRRKLRIVWETAGQDGGVGRHTVPPRTTKRRTTTILKQKTTTTARKSNCMEVRQPRR